MSKKVFKICSIISLILCIMVTLVIIVFATTSPVPTIENTTEQTITVEYVKRVTSVGSFIGVKEYSYELVVWHDLVSNSVALSNLSAGDTISVRQYTSIDSCEVWALSANGVNIILLDDSYEFVAERNKQLLPVGIVFSCLFAATTVICFCAYKGVFNKHKV